MPKHDIKTQVTNALIWGGGIFFCFVFWFVVFSWLFISPVEAQEDDYEPWGNPIDPKTISDYYLPNQTSPQGSLGFIVHFNNLDHPNTDKEQFWAVETPYGEFIFRVEITPNNQCETPCPDMVELWASPDGYTVSPFISETPEYGTTVMDIFKQVSS